MRRLAARRIRLRPAVLLGFTASVALLALSPRGPSGDDKSVLFFVSLVLGAASVCALVYSPARATRGSAAAALPLVFLMHGILTAIVVARGTFYPFAGGNLGEALNSSVLAAVIEWGVAAALVGPRFAREANPAVPSVPALLAFIAVAGLAFAPAVSFPEFGVVDGPGPARARRFAVGHRTSQHTALVGDILVQIRQPADGMSAQVWGWDIKRDARWRLDVDTAGTGYPCLVNPSFVGPGPGGALGVVYQLSAAGGFSGSEPYRVVWLDPSTGTPTGAEIVETVAWPPIPAEEQWVHPATRDPDGSGAGWPGAAGGAEPARVEISRTEEPYPGSLEIRGDGFLWRIGRDNGSRWFIVSDDILVMRELLRLETWYHIWLLPAR